MLKESLQRYWYYLLVAFFFMLMTASATASIAYIFKPALDTIFYQPQSITQIYYFCLTLFVIFIGKGIGQYGEEVALGCAANNIVRDLQIRMFSHLLHCDTFQDQATGALTARLTSELSTLRQSLILIFQSCGKDLMTLCFLCGIIFYFDPFLTVFSLVVLPCFALPIMYISRKLKSFNQGMQTKNAELSGMITEVLRHIRIVKSFTNELLEIEHFQRDSYQMMRDSLSITRWGALTAPLTECIAGLTIAFIAGYGAISVYHGQKTTGAFIAFISALLLAYEPLKRLTALTTHIQSVKNILARIQDVLSLPIAQTSHAPNITLKGAITMENVSFAYHGAHYVLRDINIDIAAGERVAFVGASGSGKSTLLNLLLGFVQPTSGRILMDGYDSALLDARSLRKQIALVSQDLALFDMSIEDNIRYGRGSAVSADIAQVIQDVELTECVSALPQGYQTRIGENGSHLSGGQKQRLTIARALIKNAPILLFDEATSALDDDTQAKIDHLLERMTRGKTTIIVTHDLEAVSYVDRVYALDRGRIVV